MSLVKTTESLDLTVVIPFYNRSNYAKRLLDSVIQQSLTPKFIFFVDNGSKIEELERLHEIINSVDHKDINIQCLKTEKFGNANYARNLGLEQANTQYVAFLDSDDWWEPCHLENSLKILNKSSKAGIYGGAIIHYGNSKVVNSSGDIALVDTPYHILFSNAGWSAQTSSYIVNKNKLKNLKWDESLKRHQDYDFFLALQYLTEGWVFNPIPTSHLERDDAVSGRNFDIKSMIGFLEKWKQKFPETCLKKYLVDQMDLCIIANIDKKYYEYYENIYLNLVDSNYVFHVEYIYRNLRQKIIFFLKKHGLFSLFKIILRKHK